MSTERHTYLRAVAALPKKARQWAGSLWAIMAAANRQNNAVLVKLDELVKATTDASHEVIEQQPEQQKELHRRLHHGGAHQHNGRSAQPACEGELPRVTSLKALVALLDGSDEVYLRYSKGPEHDGGAESSRDYEADVEMPGLSVCAVMPEAWWPRPAEEWVARRIRQYADLADDERFPWLLTGVQVGSGPDHEPLLTDIRPIAVLDRRVVDEAAHLYRSRFRVGNDSSSGRESAGQQA